MQHSAIPAGSIHPAHNWAFASSVEREGLVGATTEDLGKMAWQQNDGSLWLLTSVSPLTWTPVGGVNYSLPTASAETLGGVKVGDRLSIVDGFLSADVQSGGGGSVSYLFVSHRTEGSTGYYTIATPSTVRRLDASSLITNIAGASVNGTTYEITLPAGTYITNGYATVAGSPGENTITLTGTGFNVVLSTLASSGIHSLAGAFTLSATTVFTIKHHPSYQCFSSATNYRVGYTSVNLAINIIKVA